jgi:transcriptional regulator with XRE-family HTH domain
MHDLKFNPPARPPALSRQSAIPGQTRTLQNANKSALEQLGHAMETAVDPKGRQLRELRLKLGIDPSLLATQACMSLSQLYELENGGHSLFYSDSLRRQAGRRVARLLGTDWDAMGDDQDRSVKGTSNVVHLQRTVLQAVTHKPNLQLTMPPSPRPIGEPLATMVTPKSPDESSDKGDAPVGLSLASPAQETLLVQAQSPYTPSEKMAEKPSSGWISVLTLLVVAVMGAGCAYAFVEYSPYRLYWPW